jgi:lysylphosphatidylglycerol synthetase-like protein (DUF2156 family)
MAEPLPQPVAAPPRAFSQGVGTLFQTVGGLIFLVFTFFCCGSALTSKEWATHPAREKVGWGSVSGSGRALYSAKDWMTATVAAGVILGLAAAGLGLGLQADKRRAAVAAVALTLLGLAFWIVQGVFAAQAMRSIVLCALCFALAAVFTLLCVLAIGAAGELAKNPPSIGQEVLPADYQEPFSHLHQDSPEVRIANEIAQRRQKLEVQQKELEALERRLKRRMEEK